MDFSNGVSVSNINDVEIKLFENVLSSSERKTLPGYVDYSLMVLYESQRLGITIALSLLVVLSVVGNVATLVTNVRRQIRPFFRTCLVSLACSDLITTIFQSTTYFSQMATEYTPIWLLGELLCSLIPFATTLAILVNSFILVGIAMDRYVAVVKIIKGAWEPTTFICLIFAVSVWGLAAGISSPMLTSYAVSEFFIIETDPENRTHQIDVTLAEMCVGDKIPNRYYYTIVFFVIFLPVLLVFLWLNGIIAKEIWHRRHPLTANGPKNQHITMPRNQKPDGSGVDGGGAVGVSNNRCRTSLQNDDDQSTDKRTSETNTISNGVATVAHVSTSYTTNFGVLPHAKPQQITGGSQSVRTNREIRQIRMFKAILAIMVTFFVCRMPTWIFLLYKLYHIANSNFHWMLQYFFGMLSIFSCVLNPLLYTYLTETIQCSSAFVDKLKAICYCGKAQHSQDSDVITAVERRNSPKEDVGVKQFYCSEDKKIKLARVG